MPNNLFLKINLRKIRQDWCFKNDNGTHADLCLFENDQLDNYGNSHVIKQNPPKELRGKEKAIIVGNGKPMQSQGQQRPPQRQQQRPAPQQQPEDDGGEIPW